MATSNFTSGGNGGINVILDDEYGDSVKYTMDSVYDRLSELGYIMNDSRVFNDRDTLDATEVYTKDRKLVAVLHVTSGYYEHANIEVYVVAGMTDDEMVDSFEELVSGYDLYKGWYVDRSMFTRDKRHAKRVQRAIDSHTVKVVQTARFSNGETWYKEVN